jgi:Protein of unknown function (DUF4199)
VPTFLLYGLLIGLSQTLATLLLFAIGYHASAEIIARSQMMENLIGFILLMVLVGFAYRSEKAKTLARGAEFTFGRAARLAALTALLAALAAGLGQYAYRALINPAVTDILVQSALANAEPHLAPLPAEQAARHRDVIVFFNSPLFMSLVYLLNAFFFTLLLGLAYAAIFRAAARRDEAAQAKVS